MTRIKCPKCEFINPEGQSVCLRCGASLPKVRSEAGRAGPTPEAGARQRPDTLFNAGQKVAGRYTVIDVIGRGGMGAIYRVRDETLGEEVALKTLLPQFIQNKLVVERFFNEARITRHLSHPNIIRVHDIGKAGNVIYISMELLEGKALRTLLDEVPPGQHLPVETVLRVIDELCAALEYAHQYTIHRDIKPENIMIAPDGSVKLMDFGISKLMASVQLTGTSVIMGTPMYMSPEQLKNSRDVDARADVFSVGVVLYEALTGNIPTGVPKPASHVRRDSPPELDAIVSKCVEPNREHRYHTITELRDALLSVRVAVGPDAQTITTPAAKVAAAQSLGLRRIVGTGFILLILALAGLGLWKLELARSIEAAQRSGLATQKPIITFERQFRRVAELVDRARPQAELAAEDDEAKQRVLAVAEVLWERAKRHAAREDPGALAPAMDALQCFVALIDWPKDMVFIPPGEVTIGDATATGPVRLDGFFMDRTEVTVRQFLLFCARTGWRTPAILEPLSSGDLPVTMVRFYDALAFAAHHGKQIPTEAQWARAAYGAKGASEFFPWGETWKPGACNVAGTDDDFPGLAPVNSFPEDCTAFGCVDMAGNAMEWTRSACRPLPYDSKDGREDARQLYFGSEIALRGGHFGMEKAPLAARYCTTYESVHETVGFRCVRELPSRLEEIEALLSVIIGDLTEAESMD